jgi:hypothetical protein
MPLKLNPEQAIALARHQKHTHVFCDDEAPRESSFAYKDSHWKFLRDEKGKTGLESEVEGSQIAFHIPNNTYKITVGYLSTHTRISGVAWWISDTKGQQFIPSNNTLEHILAHNDMRVSVFATKEIRLDAAARHQPYIHFSLLALNNQSRFQFLSVSFLQPGVHKPNETVR